MLIRLILVFSDVLQYLGHWAVARQMRARARAQRQGCGQSGALHRDRQNKEKAAKAKKN